MKALITALTFLVTVGLATGPLLANPGEIEETYYILQQGFITVAGETNFFDFSGRAQKHQGKLDEIDELYNGEVILHFSQLDFNLPGVTGILEREDYIDSTNHPVIKIHLKEFKPADKPRQVTSELTLRGVTRQIVIDTLFDYISPVIKVEGAFVIKQTDFGITPYKQGFMKMQDELSIKFKVFFCETHEGKPSYHKETKEVFETLLTKENIKVLSEKGFFGCDELKR